MIDVLIAGGGPAGLEAALILGRARRRVLLCDLGEPRNAPAKAAHGVFTRDGTPPGELLRLGRAELAPYETVALASVGVLDARPVAGGFQVTLSDGREVTARKLVLATGVADELPPIDGMRALWGRGVYHCPYCHAFELRDRPLAVYGRGPEALELASLLTNWSAEVTLCTDGPAALSPDARHALHAAGVRVQAARIEGLARQGEDGVLVALEGEEALACAGVFLRPVLQQRSAIPARLGCRMDERNLVVVDAAKQTEVPGLYVVGDPSNPVQSVQLAAASGAIAAYAINAALTREAIARRMAAQPVLG